MRRRDLLRTSLALGGAALAAPAGVDRLFAAEPVREFPKDFRWGAATAAYQIEGSVKADGRGESIWDRFSHTPDAVRNGDTGDVACDSYRRWREDVALLRELKLNSYRFSISWPRIQADGRGAANQKGVDHYKRLVDALLEANIRPLVTLYHWDIPQGLVDRGGWTSRDTGARFVDYAQIMARALSAHVKDWAIFNEPKACAHYAYLRDASEPLGYDPAKFLIASHVINLTQGDAFRAIKAIDATARVGGAYDVSPMFPASDSAADKAAAERFHRFQNLWFLTPPLEGKYPDGVLPPERLHALLDYRHGDETRIRADLDFIGVNYYSRFFVRHVDDVDGVPGLNVKLKFGAPDAKDVTDFGWEVYPQGLYDIVFAIARATGNRPIEITENGCSYLTAPGRDGLVHDTKRSDFLRSHLRALASAIRDGAPVRSYHCWSLLDNFEWTSGYSQRFGLVYVDYVNGRKRTIKDSALWYARVAQSSAIPA